MLGREVFMLSIATKMFARVEDAVHGLCSCSSSLGSCFRLFGVTFLFVTFALVGKAFTLPFQFEREQPCCYIHQQYIIAGGYLLDLGQRSKFSL